MLKFQRESKTKHQAKARLNTSAVVSNKNHFASPLSVRAVGWFGLGLFWIRGFDVGLLRDNTVAPQPLGSSPARTHCACDLPGPRLPEGLLTLWGVVEGHVNCPHGQNQAH